MATSSEACVLTPRKCFAEEDKSVGKWSEKNKLFRSHSFVFAFRLLASEIIIFWLFCISERIFGGYFQWKACALLQKIYGWTGYIWEQGIYEQGIYGSCKTIRKSYISLVALLYFYFKFLPSKIVNLDVFLPIKEFSVARALIPRKYMVEQG